MLKLDHLCRVEHEEAAKLLARVQDDLRALTRIVRRAPFTDRVMRCQKGVQERLIDPLKEAADKQGYDDGPKSIYPSVYYAIGRAS